MPIEFLGRKNQKIYISGWLLRDILHCSLFTPSNVHYHLPPLVVYEFPGTVVYRFMTSREKTCPKAKTVLPLERFFFTEKSLNTN